MSESKLDRGTKIYIGVLVSIALAILIAWLLSLDTRAWEINDRLEEDPEISAYPFPFRVLETANGIAVVASPRSADVPVMEFLGLVDPSLRNADPSSAAAMVAARSDGSSSRSARARRSSVPSTSLNRPRS